MAVTAVSTEALKEVRARVAASGSSFTAGMRILPRDRREAMFALYAFCREVDDIADDGATPESRRADLDGWREKIARLFREGKGEEPITQALAPAIQRFGLVETDFQTIIDGMAMDAGATPLCGPSMATLDLYCDRVASAVGRVSVRIFGDSSDNAQRVAHHLGRAFQLTNILRDLAEDAERGRLYLPEELLARHRVASRDPKAVLEDPGLRPVCRDLARQAQEHFVRATAAMRLCRQGAMRPAQLMGAFYRAILERLIAEDWRDPRVRVTLSAFEKLRLALRVLVGGAS